MTRHDFLRALAQVCARRRQPGAALYLRTVSAGGAWSLRVVLDQLTAGERAALPSLWQRAIERRIAAGIALGRWLA